MLWTTLQEVQRSCAKIIRRKPEKINSLGDCAIVVSHVDDEIIQLRQESSVQPTAGNSQIPIEKARICGCKSGLLLAILNR